MRLQPKAHFILLFPVKKSKNACLNVFDVVIYLRCMIVYDYPIMSNKE